MENNVVSISELKVNQSRGTIVARITRLWYGVRRGISAKNAKLEAIGLDEQGNHIHIEIDNEDVPKYKCLLSEGNIYRISKFAVKSESKYKPVIRDVKLIFTSLTEVVQLRETDVQIPKHKFEFEDYQIVHDCERRDAQLFDLIGVYIGGGEPPSNDKDEGRTERTDVAIQDLNGKQCKITLWGDISKHFNSMRMLAHEGTKILIFTSLLVRDYIPPSCASCTAATKIYVNLDYPEVTRYLQRYEKEKIEPILLPSPSKKSKVDNMVAVDKTVIQLQQLPRDLLKSDTLYVCTAKIVEFDLDNDWYYLACENCWKKMWQTDEGLRCRSCNPKVTAPIPWYKIVATVADSTGQAQFVHLGRVGDDLVGMPISTLLAIDSCDRRMLPPRLAKLENTVMKFGVVVNPKSLNAAELTFNVLKIFKEEATVIPVTSRSLIATQQTEAGSHNSAIMRKGKGVELKEQEIHLDDYDDYPQDFESPKKGVVISDSPVSCPTPRKRISRTGSKKLKQVAEPIHQRSPQRDLENKVVDVEVSRKKPRRKLRDMDSLIAEESYEKEDVLTPASLSKEGQSICLKKNATQSSVQASRVKRRKVSNQVVSSTDSDDEADQPLAKLFSCAKVRKSNKQQVVEIGKGTKRNLRKK